MSRLQERTSAAPLSSATIRRHVLLGAAITALGGLLFGYDTGVISGALLFTGKDFPGRHHPLSQSQAGCETRLRGTRSLLSLSVATRAPG
jgi:hypothetical protein